MLHFRKMAGQKKEMFMPRFIIERNFAEQLEVNRDVATAVTQVNTDVGVQLLFSFLSADKKKTYCLYEAPNAEAIREAARRLNIPADVIIEVGEVRPEMFVQEARRTGRASLAAVTSSLSLCASGGRRVPSS